jgi:hypothetical protein
MKPWKGLERFTCRQITPDRDPGPLVLRRAQDEVLRISGDLKVSLSNHEGVALGSNQT